jgi:hypothetical protein
MAKRRGISSVTVATMPALLAHLVDGATDFDGGGRPTDAIEEHRRHLGQWYGGLIGLSVVRASAAPELARTGVVAGLPVAVVADTGVERLGGAVALLRAAQAQVHRAEAAVAKRGEDPVPGLRRLLNAAENLAVAQPDLALHAEIPLTGGLLDALDVIAAAGAGRVGVAFRVGGLAGELFPPPAALAGVICACRDRGLQFSVSDGLYRALRHNDHETGFAHHGVLNVLAACLAAATGGGPGVVAERLATNDPMFLSETVRSARDLPRPLWTGYTTSRVEDIVHDLKLFEVLSSENAAAEAAGSGEQE